MAQDGDTLFVGGRFNKIGPNEGRTAIIDSATGNANTSFPRMYGYSRLVPDGNGGMYVVGNAGIQIGGQFRSRLALYANGNIIVRERWMKL